MFLEKKCIRTPNRARFFMVPSRNPKTRQNRQSGWTFFFFYIYITPWSYILGTILFRGLPGMYFKMFPKKNWDRHPMAAIFQYGRPENLITLISRLVIDVGSWFWCQNLCFSGQGIQWIWFWENYTKYFMTQHEISKMAADASSRKLKNVISLILFNVESRPLCQNVCFLGQGIQ